MRSARWVVLGVLLAAGVTFAEPATQPTKKKSIRVVQPWSKVADLSDAQREELSAIHAEITDKINALRDEERDRCMAVLTEAQKSALEATLAQEAAERKARSAQRRAATKPSGE